MKYPSYLEAQVEAYLDKQANIFTKQCHDLCEVIYNADPKNVVISTELLREVILNYEENFGLAFKKFRKENHRDELLFLVSFDHAYNQIKNSQVLDIFSDLDYESESGDSIQVPIAMTIIRDFEFARNTDVSIL